MRRVSVSTSANGSRSSTSIGASVGPRSTLGSTAPMRSTNGAAAIAAAIRTKPTTRFAPGDAREDWAILRALSDVLGRRLPFDSLGQLRARLYGEVPHLAAVDSIEPADPAAVSRLAAVGGKVEFIRATEINKPFVLASGAGFLISNTNA